MGTLPAPKWIDRLISTGDRRLAVPRELEHHPPSLHGDPTVSWIYRGIHRSHAGDFPGLPAGSGGANLGSCLAAMSSLGTRGTTTAEPPQAQPVDSAVVHRGHLAGRLRDDGHIESHAMTFQLPPLSWTMKTNAMCIE
eukprot:Skav219188  [mRNA]  locus=scaffold648:634522:636997:- [translate_table: standard]